MCLQKSYTCWWRVPFTFICSCTAPQRLLCWERSGLWLLFACVLTGSFPGGGFTVAAWRMPGPDSALLLLSPAGLVRGMCLSVCACPLSVLTGSAVCVDCAYAQGWALEYHMPSIPHTQQALCMSCRIPNRHVCIIDQARKLCCSIVMVHIPCAHHVIMQLGRACLSGTSCVQKMLELQACSLGTPVSPVPAGVVPVNEQGH